MSFSISDNNDENQEKNPFTLGDPAPLPDGSSGLPGEFMPLKNSTREQILQRFEFWLDEVLDQEEPPQGIAAEILAQLQGNGQLPASQAQEQTDLYTLWSALMNLIQETRQQGQNSRQIQETLTPMTGLNQSVSNLIKAHEEALNSARSIAEEARSVRSDQVQIQIDAARQQEHEKVIDLLLDIRDQFEIELRAAEYFLNGQSQNGVSGIGLLMRKNKYLEQQNSTIKTLMEGYKLALARLDEALEQFGFHRIRCLGEYFNPTTMTAVANEQTSSAPGGTVLEILRTGYYRDDKVYRPAQVRVACESEAESK